MPKVWDDQTHRENIVLKVQDADHFRKMTGATPLLVAQHTNEATLPTMRNWVIKSLCGFDSQVISRFKTYFPSLTAEFDELHGVIQALLFKCRQINHQNTKK